MPDRRKHESVRQHVGLALQSFAQFDRGPTDCAADIRPPYTYYPHIDALPEGRLRLGESNAGWGRPIPPGTYVMRLMKDDGYNVLAELASFEVRRHPPPD